MPFLMGVRLVHSLVPSFLRQHGNREKGKLHWPKLVKTAFQSKTLEICDKGAKYSLLGGSKPLIQSYRFQDFLER